MHINYLSSDRHGMNSFCLLYYTMFHLDRPWEEMVLSKGTPFILV